MCMSGQHSVALNLDYAISKSPELAVISLNRLPKSTPEGMRCVGFPFPGERLMIIREGLLLALCRRSEAVREEPVPPDTDAGQPDPRGCAN